MICMSWRKLHARIILLIDYYYDINVYVVSLVPIQSKLWYRFGQSACKKVPV